MEITCQRCHETLREADRYCPVCGLPQLIYVVAETPVIPLGGDATSEIRDMASFGDGIVWRPAMQVAILLALPAALLGSSLNPILGLIWIMGAAAWSVVLYSRRIRIRDLSMGVGARIGLITGLFTAWLSIGVTGMGLWITRFQLHHGALIDSEWVTFVDKSQQIIAAMGVANAQSSQSAQASRAIMLSPEGQAGNILASLLFMAGFMLLLATLGGAVGARYLTPKRSPGA